MTYKCCKCDDCACVGCVSILMDGIVDTLGAVTACDTAIDGAYNRRVTFWTRERTSVSPFDYFETTPEEAASYPGTKCRWVADLCCGANMDDTLPDPDEPENPDIEPPPPPPPPPPGP